MISTLSPPIKNQMKFWQKTGINSSNQQFWKEEKRESRSKWLATWREDRNCTVMHAVNEVGWMVESWWVGCRNRTAMQWYNLKCNKAQTKTKQLQHNSVIHTHLGHEDVTVLAAAAKWRSEIKTLTASGHTLQTRISSLGNLLMAVKLKMFHFLKINTACPSSPPPPPPPPSAPPHVEQKLTGTGNLISLASLIALEGSWLQGTCSNIYQNH